MKYFIQIFTTALFRVYVPDALLDAKDTQMKKIPSCLWGASGLVEEP